MISRLKLQWNLFQNSVMSFKRNNFVEMNPWIVSCLLFFISIDEINRDVIRTFHNHQLFHYPENHGQEVLDIILRRLSDSFVSLGYCQGMNYVAGAIMVSIVDPNLYHYCNDIQSDSNCKMYIIIYQVLFYRMNKEDICSQSLSILSMMISFLDLKSLWGYGFPAISIYSFILRSFLEYHQIPVSFI